MGERFGAQSINGNTFKDPKMKRYQRILRLSALMACTLALKFVTIDDRTSLSARYNFGYTVPVDDKGGNPVGNLERPFHQAIHNSEKWGTSGNHFTKKTKSK